MSATYEYGPRGDMPPVRLTWYQGENKPEIWRKDGIPQWDNGCLFIGAKGMLLADYGRHVLLPEKDFADFRRPSRRLPRVAGPSRRVDPRLQDRRADARPTSSTPAG